MNYVVTVPEGNLCNSENYICPLLDEFNWYCNYHNEVLTVEKTLCVKCDKCKKDSLK